MCVAPQEDEEGAADSVSASEARRRLEKFRARVKAEQQAAAAAKDTVAKVGRGPGGLGRGCVVGAGRCATRAGADFPDRSAACPLCSE